MDDGRRATDRSSVAVPDSETPAASRSRGRASRPVLRDACRRAEIVRAALASFAEHGYERASLRDIAARADVTHAALLRHFASKDDLLLAALAQRDLDDEELARRIMQSRVPAERVLSSVLADEFAHPEHQRNWLAITVAATNPDHPAHEFFIARRERMRVASFKRTPADGEGWRGDHGRREGHPDDGHDGWPSNPGAPRPDPPNPSTPRNLHATARHRRRSARHPRRIVMVRLTTRTLQHSAA